MFLLHVWSAHHVFIKTMQVLWEWLVLTYPGINYTEPCQKKQSHDSFTENENDADITQH